MSSALALVQPQPVFPRQTSYWKIGHRGLPLRAPENTLASFDAAVKAGADMVEFDVTWTRDQIPVVIHDRTLERTSDGRGSVRNKSWKELQNLDAGSWFSSKFRGERIPSLEEVLEHLQGRVAMNLEIKREAMTSRRVGGIEEKVVRAVARRSLEAHVIISSFSSKTVRRVKKLSPKIPTALLFKKTSLRRLEREMRRTGADALHLSLDGFSEEIQAWAKANGVPLRVYTVNQVSEMDRLVRLGVDGIFTDDLSRLVAL